MQALLDDLKVDEGFRSMPYYDTVGVLTVAHGYNLIANPLRLSSRKIASIKKHGISEKEAESLLIQCVKQTCRELDEKLSWVYMLPKTRQDVLINMAFNMGIKTLLTFKNTLRLIQDGDYEGAAQAMMKSKWSKQVGNRAKRLAEQMRTGVRA